MTTQQAYEQIREYFNAYGAELAKSTSGTCKYRTAEGAACAVGCLIPDERYTERMEGSSMNVDWLERNPFVEGLLYGVDKGFLRAAQTIHDGVAGDARQFVTGLDLLAVLYGLDSKGHRGEGEFLAPLV